MRRPVMTPSRPALGRPWLLRFATLLAACTLVFILRGHALVSSSHSRRLAGVERQQQVPTSPLQAAILSSSLTMLANPQAMTSLDEVTLDCVKYSGPCFYMNHPNGDAPTQRVRTASHHEPPVLRPTPLPLRPFSLHNVSLLPGTRFHTAQLTNVEWLRRLEPDRMLYYFRNLSGLPQPRGVRPHGGWDGAGVGLRGHMAGHYLTAASLAAATTGGDAVLLSNLARVVDGLDECQQALHEGGYLSAFPQSEFEQMERLPAPRNAWVPYYVMHKLLAGLLDYHRLWRVERQVAGGRRSQPLEVAIRLAEHLWRRYERLSSHGMARWHTFINQEVGGMSEVLTDLALLTGNSSWLTLAEAFERPCFIGPLMLSYKEHEQPQPPLEPTAAVRAAGGSIAARAIEFMHGNTHLPQLLGAMARYEATGDVALRGAAEAFWHELSSSHTFVTGGSTVSETWRPAATLGDAVSQRGRGSFGAHDVHETCVSHNSMRVSRKLLSWGGDGADASSGIRHTMVHAAYYERTMHNAVLGTQRGTLPGSMLYQYPMGGGVSKNSHTSGSELHHWGYGHNGSNPRVSRLFDLPLIMCSRPAVDSDQTTHWCCQGTGIEAFSRLADSIYWLPSARAHGSPLQLFVLQSISSRLEWTEQQCVVELEADPPGSRSPNEPLRSILRVRRHTLDVNVPALLLWVRVPLWAQDVEASAAGALHIPPQATLRAGTLLPLVYEPSARFAGDDVSFGQLTLRWRGSLSWERVRDSRSRFEPLQSALWGPVVLAALTYGERALSVNATLQPVPPAARQQLGTLAAARTAVPRNDSSLDACLVTRWDHVWVVWADRTRSFVKAPQKACVQRATPVGDEISAWSQRAGGAGPRYHLDATESRLACAAYEGCLADGTSPFASGKLVVMHNGTGGSITLTATPPTVNGTRRGGTDAANAATWRLTPSPVVDGVNISTTTRLPTPGVASVSYLEAIDLPGRVLTASLSNGQVSLQPFDPHPMARGWVQAWQVVGGTGAGAMRLRSADDPRKELTVEGMNPTEAPLLLHQGAFASRTCRLVLTDRHSGGSPFVWEVASAEYPPLAFWAISPQEKAGSRVSYPYLMVPLNEIVDEHYSVYVCRVPAGEAPPAYCYERL